MRAARDAGLWLLERRNAFLSRIGLATAGTLRRSRHFTFAGERYDYYVARYNDTWANERAVELAIAARRIAEAGAGRVLEVGNVLGHYFRRSHDVIDKYESGAGVRNIDVLEFRAEAPYDLIVCISTLEHMGWDEDIDDPAKPVRALDHLVGMLAPGGQLLATIPLGYNPHVDAALRQGRLRFDDLRYMKRLGRNNRWAEVSDREVVAARYGSPYPKANALALGMRSKPVG